jgi:hypothetical protein
MESQSSSPKPNNLEQSPEVTIHEETIDRAIWYLLERIEDAFHDFKKKTELPWFLLFSIQDLALSLKNQKKGPGTDVESLQKVKIRENKEASSFMSSISAFEKSSILWQAFKTIDENTRMAIRNINSESRNLNNKAIRNLKRISSLELRKSIAKKVFFIKSIYSEEFLFCKIEKAGEEMLGAGKGYVHKAKWKLMEICFKWLFFNERDPSKNKRGPSFIRMLEGVNNWLSPKSADSTMPDFLIAWNDSYPNEKKPKEIKTYEARLAWNLFLSEEIIKKSKIPKKKGSKSQKLVRFNLNDKLTSDGVISDGGIEKMFGALTDKLKERVT